MVKNKNEGSSVVQNFHAMVKNQFGKTIKIVRTDNGHEFKILDFFNKNNISYHVLKLHNTMVL